MTLREKVLILTPVKNGAPYIAGHFERLNGLSYPHELLSVGVLESDSVDNSMALLQRMKDAYEVNFRSVTLCKRDFNFHLPAGVPRWAPSVQIQRRSILARCRNHLLFSALDDEDWVLWLDVDVIRYPRDLIERLLSFNKDILHPNCVKEPGGPSFDLNAWRDHGKLHQHDLRGGDELVPLDAVGGTVLFVRANCHRDGLIFPPFLYGKQNSKVRTNRPDFDAPDESGEIETEGFGILASDMNLQCWGVPNLEVQHANR
ncbi:MAG TPA: hypothetical protein V6C81_21885 [Planktothrix sp.]|jgi:peptide chain release factor subunit 1